MAGETIKTKAIVIKSRPHGENDRMLTLVSADMGRIFVSAKGVRSLKHKSRASAQFLSYGEFVLKKIKDGLYSLVSGEVTESFSEICKSVELLSYASYFCSLCESCIMQLSPANEETRLLLNCLYMLSKRQDDAPYIKAVFELRLASCCGFMPDFSENCSCGNAASYFSLSDGISKCALHKTSDCISISPAAAKICNFIVSASLRDALFALFPSSEILSAARVSEDFLCFQLGFHPKSLSYLHNIVKKTL